MSIRNDIRTSIQSGDLKKFCENGFPPESTFIMIFWNSYVNSGKAAWDDYLPALKELVDQGHLTESPNGWFNFAAD